MFRRSYFLVRAKNVENFKQWDIVKGHWGYSAPFHPTDMSKVYILGGLAIGYKAFKKYLERGDIVRISKKEAIETLLRDIR